MNKGSLIVFEGIDGSGKSFALKQFTDNLDKRNVDYVSTSAIGSGGFGKKLREMLVESKQRSLSSSVETLLFLAAIQAVVEDVISPNIDAGRHVVLDRYFYSTLVYQSIRAESHPSLLGLYTFNLLREIDNFPRPNHLIYMDITAEAAIQNINSGRDSFTEMDKDVCVKAQKYIDLYKTYIKSYPGNIKNICLDSNPPYPKIYQELEDLSIALAREQGK